MKFVVKNPDKAYIYDYLWLPKKHTNEAAIKSALSFWILEKGSPAKREAWKETEDHILVPRRFIGESEYLYYPFPFVDARPKSFPSVQLSCKIALRKNQVPAFEAMKQSEGGVLQLSPGKGKTVISLRLIFEYSIPALIVVHNSYLMEQWKDRIAQFLPGTPVGIIQGKKFQWDAPISVAMIQTLASRSRTGDIPPEFNKHFGLAIFDEVHHLAAPVFLETAPLILGKRFGLSATPNRADGLESLYQWHIGPVAYEDTSRELTPKVYFQKTPIRVDTKTVRAVRDRAGQVNIPKLRSYLAKLDPSNDFREKCIREALDKGRNILCLSHSKDQLIELHKRFPGSALIVAETPQSERTEMVVANKLVFAIARLGVEGLDDVHLDTLIYLTPFSGDTELEQAMGRIQRVAKGKKEPIFVVLEDNIPEFKGMCRKLRFLLRRKGLDYETLEPF